MNPAIDLAERHVNGFRQMIRADEQTQVHNGNVGGFVSGQNVAPVGWNNRANTF